MFRSSRPARRAAFLAAVALAAIASLSASPAFAAPEPWSDPVEAAEYTTTMSAHVVMPNGTIVGTIETHLGLATVTSVDAGLTWSDPVYVTAVEYPFRSSIASTSTGLLAVTWVEGDFDRSVLVSTSADGGATWSEPETLPVAGTDADDPIVASSSPNGFTIVWKESFTKRGVASTDGGATWSAPEVITQDMNSYGAASLVPTGTGEIVVIFQEFDGMLAEYSIQSRTSTDGGLTWGPKVAVAPAWPAALSNGLYAVGVSPAVGSVIAVWTHGVDESTDSLFAATSTDSGATWSAPITVGSPAYLRYFRVQATDATSAGIVWYAYTDTASMSYATVALGASAASAPVIVNPDPVAAYEYLPSLTVSGDLRLVTWSEGGDGTAAYLVSASCDAGATWTEPLALASGETVATGDAVSMVSGTTFTTVWGGYAPDFTNAWVFASSTDSPCAGAEPDVLPVTGSDLGVPAMLFLGVGLLGIGALVAVRRRTAG